MLFSTLNLFFLVEELHKNEYFEYPHLKQLFLMNSEIILYLLGAVTLLGMILDLLPAKWLQRKRGKDPKDKKTVDLNGKSKSKRIKKAIRKEKQSGGKLS